MKRAELLREAKSLGDDSWELSNFVDVKTKGQRAVADALDRDAKWIRDHSEYIAQSINRLARRVRDEGIDDGRRRCRVRRGGGA